MAQRMAGFALQQNPELLAQVAPAGLDAVDNYIYGTPGVPMRIRSADETEERNRRIMNMPTNMPRQFYESFPSI
jgi:hypothetical protein